MGSTELLWRGKGRKNERQLRVYPPPGRGIVPKFPNGPDGLTPPGEGEDFSQEKNAVFLVTFSSQRHTPKVLIEFGV